VRKHEEVKHVIIDNDLSVEPPSSAEDVETMVFHNIICKDYDSNKYIFCERKDDFQEFIDRIEEYRSLFDKDNIGYIGKKTSKKNVTNKLLKFHNDHPEYSIDDIIKATEAYINNNITKPQYIMKSCNFIYKREGGIWKTVLLDWLLQEEENKFNQQSIML